MEYSETSENVPVETKQLQMGGQISFNGIDRLVNLKTLKLEYGSGKVTIPAQIIGLHKLEELECYAVQIEEWPIEIFMLPKLKKVSIYNIWDGDKPYEQLLEASVNLPIPLRVACYHLLSQNHKELEKTPLQDILSALNVSIKLVRQRAILYLNTRLHPLYQKNPLHKGSRLAIAGTLTSNISELKNELIKSGVEASSKITDKTSHIVIGEKLGNKVDDITKHVGATLLSEKHLISFLRANEAPLPHTINNEMVSHLKELLRSNNKSNQVIALETIRSLEILRKEELSNEMLSLLYIHYHLAYDATVRKTILAILSKYGTEALIKFLPEKVILFKTMQDEEKVCKALKLIEQQTGLSGEIMATELYHQPIHSGKKYIVQFGTDPQLKYKIIEEFLKADNLNLSQLKLDFIPAEITHFVSVKKLRVKKSFVKEIPKCLLQLPNLEVLEVSECQVVGFPGFLEGHPNLKQLLLFWNKIDVLPPSIKGFTCLQKLDLGLNKLKEIPEGFLNFPALKTLNLESNYLTHLPGTLVQLKKLQELNIRNNKNLKVDENRLEKLSLKKLKHFMDI